MDREKILEDFEYAVRKSHREGWNYVDGLTTEDGFKILQLLKEQEAVRPEREHSGGGTTWWNVCGNCKTAINPNDKFCHECGKGVKW